MIPKAQTELGKKEFRFLAPNAWNKFQSELQLQALVALNEFKALKSLGKGKFICRSQFNNRVTQSAL